MHRGSDQVQIRIVDGGVVGGGEQVVQEIDVTASRLERRAPGSWLRRGNRCAAREPTPPLTRARHLKAFRSGSLRSARPWCVSRRCEGHIIYGDEVFASP